MSDVIGEVRSASREVLDLAVSFEPGQPFDRQRIAELRSQLDELAARLQPLVGHDADGARISLADAYMDLDWIESGGLIPTSIRLDLARRAGLGGS